MVRRSIGLRLALSFIAVVLVTGCLAGLMGYNLIFRNIIGQAYSTILSHMNTTQYIYNDRTHVIHLFMDHLASLDYIQEAIQEGDRQLLVDKLQETRRELELDILNLTDSEGRILARGRNPDLHGDDVSRDLFVQKVLEDRESFEGSDLMSREQLLKEGEELAEQARIDVLPTPHARSSRKMVEERGLVLKAASPILHDGKLLGVIYGAKLLNNNFEFVDRIKTLVFKGEQFEGHDVGNATIFLDDVRISTNVRNQGGDRAVGTRVSEEVYELVVEKENTWLDKAFVVDRWYISAYTPIYDLNEDVIGILYVGILEDKFNAIERRTALSFLGVILLSGFVAILISIYFIRRIAGPYRALMESSREIARGNYDRKIEIQSDDEVGRLGRTFNQMVDAIRQRDEALKEQTHKQISQSEKLASVGRMASGIAHEINNPLTGILTYGSMLQEDLKDTEYEEDVRTIVDETMRCRKIVRGILDFARETQLEREEADLNWVLNESLNILQKQLEVRNIRIIRQLDPDLPHLMIDINLMKSVFNNFALNAADAMPEGGTLTVRTGYDPESDLVRVEFEDTGVGIPEENLEKIFDPFFTTKEPGKGTGLGMAVSYGIVSRHKGDIRVESQVGEGTRVICELPPNELNGGSRTATE